MTVGARLRGYGGSDYAHVVDLENRIDRVVGQRVFPIAVRHRSTGSSRHSLKSTYLWIRPRAGDWLLEVVAEDRRERLIPPMDRTGCVFSSQVWN